MDMIAEGVELPDAPQNKPEAAVQTAAVNAPKPAQPVMDIRPPASNDIPPVHAAPPEPEEKNDEEKPAEKPKPTKQPKVRQPKTPREPGIGLAVTATIIIILGLAGLAVYAYLKSNNIPVF